MQIDLNNYQTTVRHNKQSAESLAPRLETAAKRAARTIRQIKKSKCPTRISKRRLKKELGEICECVALACNMRGLAFDAVLKHSADVQEKREKARRAKQEAQI